ncbi:TPA: AAA family ATPase [Aeromonas veronii]|nr:AAA family ATPase [Aeromonas veronii]
MARGDDVIALARHALDGNRDMVVTACRCIIANEPVNSSLKERMRKLLLRMPTLMPFEDLVPEGLKGLVIPASPEMGVDDVELPENVLSELELFFEEQRFSEEIHSSGLNLPHKILMSGPPGNGKTTLAGVIAKELDLPLFVVDFSSVVSNLLGETGAKIAKLFRGVTQKPCVLFLDEMETVLSERASGSNDVGEMKRIVSTLLLEIDRLPDHVILVGATNHEELLDRAVVRRFDFEWSLPKPTDDQVQEWLHRFAKRYPEIPILSEMPPIAADGRSFSDISREVNKWCRRWIVAQASSPQPQVAVGRN